MRLGMVFGYSTAQLSIDIELIKHAEKLGYHSVWSAEAWGSDAATPLAWIAAQTSKIKLGTGIMQMPGRSPANTAMTAMTLDSLSNGRFILGLGTSGPQVVEGWHGVPYHKPLTWTREYVEVVRKIFERKEPLTYDGEIIQLPTKHPKAMGLGKPLKSILHGNPKIPIYLGSMAPKAQAQAGKIADGLLMTCLDPTRVDIVENNLKKGFETSGKTLDDPDSFDLVPAVAVIVGDDLDACRGPLKMTLALYVGGMGAKKKNFYKEYVEQVGFGEAAEKIQALYLDGKRGEAIAAVPDEMVDAFNLVGPKERIRDEFQKWKESRVGTMLIGTQQPEALELMAELNS